ncbi:MAG: Hpt domain-containing protein [Pseudohongiellaceae bacterium]
MTENSTVIKIETLSELKEILEDDFELLVSSYLEDAHSRMERLEAAIAAADAAVIKAEAHSLKGSSLNLGAQSLPELCSVLEKCGNDEALQDTPELFSKIQGEFAKVQSILKNHVA